MQQPLYTLFVYGSLRSGFYHPAYEYISKYFKLIGPAKVKGILYDMGNYPAALPTDEDSSIIGELYELKDSRQFSYAFDQLDDYEGVKPEEGEQALYRRATTQVYYNETETEAWIYWFNGEVTDQPIVPSGDILQFIQQKSKL